jgi:hypothetical protein
MTMQMIVTYQKTKWIRSACSEAAGGSQFGITATAVVIPPMTSASSVSWTIAPRRICEREPIVSCGRAVNGCVPPDASRSLY